MTWPCITVSFFVNFLCNYISGGRLFVQHDKLVRPRCYLFYFNESWPYQAWKQLFEVNNGVAFKQYTPRDSEGTLLSETSQIADCLLLTPGLTQSSAFPNHQVTIDDQAAISQAPAFFNHQTPDWRPTSLGYEEPLDHSQTTASQAPAFFNYQVTDWGVSPSGYGNTSICGPSLFKLHNQWTGAHARQLPELTDQQRRSQYAWSGFNRWPSHGICRFFYHAIVAQQHNFLGAW